MIKFGTVIDLLLKKKKMKDVLELKTAKAIAAYNKGSAEEKKFLENLYGKEVFNQKITDRLNSLEDVCEACGYTYQSQFGADVIKHMTPYEVANREYRLICKAANEGTKITKNTMRYYPYFTSSACGLSLFGVGYGGADTGVAPHLCMKSQELVRWAVAKFPKTFEILFSDAE